MAETNPPIDKIISVYNDPRVQEKALYHYPTPIQIATYSTKLPKDDNESPRETDQIDEASEIARRYSKTKPYNRVLCDSPTANLRFLFVPSESELRQGFDIQKNYNKVTERDSRNEYLSLLLECLDREGLVGKSDFVAKRGSLVEIAGTPLRYERGAKILVQKLDNVYYLFRFYYENNQQRQHSNQQVYQSDQAHRRARNEYGGRKFETYVTVKKGESKPDSDTLMDYNFELNSVVYTKLGEHSVILAGEVDCCLPEDTTTMCS